MPTEHLTDARVRRLKAPAAGNKITYDDTVKGFGARVTAAGARSYVLTYTVRGSGKQRRFTIGGCDRWTASDARTEAKRLKHLIDQGGDPLQDIEDERSAPTMTDLIERFEAEHLERKREGTRVDYRLMIKTHIAPHFGKGTKVTDVTFDDIDALHRSITRRGHKYRANRVLALLSTMFALSVKRKMRTDNPCKGVERNREHHRRRYLSPEELQRLTTALATFPERDVADVVRLLLLTGARKGEVLSMKWEHLDLTAGTWSKPPSSTKQDQHHQGVLNAPARALLAERLSMRKDGEMYVFPGARGNNHRGRDIWHTWQKLLKAAGIKDLRVHDLRHSFASQLASGGASLPLIGALLGHSAPATTHRYAHLFDDAQRAAVERVGSAIANAGRPTTEPVPLRGHIKKL